MRKYYFAYHDFNGRLYATMWIEDYGICVGGRPKNILDNHKWEISLKEFEGTLSEMERKHPIQMPSAVKPSWQPD